ncbi:hypothetical protein, partial [Legionella sp.]|uniref:hypothetical protein n=1 Tax=Legionella sp. TaxID=459 RepID=UPI003C8E5555
NNIRSVFSEYQKDIPDLNKISRNLDAFVNKVERQLQVNEQKYKRQENNITIHLEDTRKVLVQQASRNINKTRSIIDELFVYTSDKKYEHELEAAINALNFYKEEFKTAENSVAMKKILNKCKEELEKIKKSNITMLLQLKVDNNIELLNKLVTSWENCEELIDQLIISEETQDMRSISNSCRFFRDSGDLSGFSEPTIVVAAQQRENEKPAKRN